MLTTPLGAHIKPRERGLKEAIPMIRVHSANLSSLKIEGMSRASTTVECGLQQDPHEIRPVPDAAWRKTRAPATDRNAEQEKQE